MDVPAEDGRVHGVVEVGVVEDHQRAVAAEFEDRALEEEAQTVATRRPTASEPVKEMTFGIGCSRKASPISAMSVMTTLSRPPGRPASSKIFAMREPPTTGVFWCGLSTTPLPSASAGATDFRESRKGKLKGLITPTTPTGTR
ncbi:hypothetical protein SHKM778_04630 [Streptomyces sp. KM77-8]|uniref:Uncharacterized protein n=1 Tax=Streptomyces haneummycinicus TaxID=3074435 RepID=A0AAT9H9M6_9ACTN